MVIGLIGENCSGKSTLADKIKDVIGAEVISGKDYLRMAKSPAEAEQLFKKKLQDAVSADNIIYIIADKDQVSFLPEGSFRVLVSAELDTVKERFRARMHGNLPAPVEKMLERKHGMFDDGIYEYRFSSESGDPDALIEAILKG